MFLLWCLDHTHSPLKLSNLSSLIFISILRSPPVPSNPVYVRILDISVLAFSLSLHRHPYICMMYQGYISVFFPLWLIWLLGSWTWLSNPLIIRQRTGLDYQTLWWSRFLRYLIDNHVIWLFRLQKLTNQTSQNKTLSKPILCHNLFSE